MHRIICSALLTASLCLLNSIVAGEQPKVDANALTSHIESRLKAHGSDIEASVWLGGVEGPWYEYKSREIRPVASSVKTFFLVELFDKYRGQLDSPLLGASEILKDDHPAISHFEPKVREDIRRDLGQATVRRVGQAMMGKTSVSNEVYNAAANLTTAILGGPEALTTAIHRRDPAFKPVEVRRYMLRDRKTPGDNEATAESLAALYQKLASKKLAGINEPTMTALHEVLHKTTDPKLGTQYYKGGSLGSDPMTRVHAGWWQTAKGPLIFVVMLEQPGPGKQDRETAEKELRQFSTDLTDEIVRTAAKAQGIE
jgi:hypothetical protein